MDSQSNSPKPSDTPKSGESSSKDSTESNTASSSHHHRFSSHHHHRPSHRSPSSVSSLSSSIIRTTTGWFQRKVNLRPVHRGCHLITDEILKNIPELSQFKVGLCNIYIMHTSASLTLNENWDPDVREDMEMFLLKFVPENLPFRHACEGPDDMPAHVKSSFIGSSINIPICEGKLCFGTWQGIWLCEHRNNAGSRKLMITINGALKN